MRNKNNLTIVVSTDRVDYQLPKTRKKSASSIKSNLKIWLQGGLTVLICVVIIFTVVKAGSLTPPGAPAATSYTLDNIYTRLTTNATSTAGSHSFAPGGSPTSTLHSLTQIYGAIPTIDPTKVLSGTTYLGIAGSASAGANLSNMWNGTCSNPETCPLGTEFPGGSQANGGVDDYNGNNQGYSPPAGRFATTWTACNSGNSYCGTGDAGASYKDTATGLTWSYLCHDNASTTGCSLWDTSAPDLTNCQPSGNCNYYSDPNASSSADSYYTWDNSGMPGSYDNGNNGMTAQQLCSQHSGWSLPSQKQLMQAYIDGAYGNLEPVGVYRGYWSSTTNSSNTNYAWYVYLSYGYTSSNLKTGTDNIRCVRSS